MPKKSVLHFSFAIYFWLISLYDWCCVRIPDEVDPISQIFGRNGKLSYLSFWTTILQSLFFTISFVNDLGFYASNPTYKSVIIKLKDLIFSCLVFPVSLSIFLTFWSLYIYDKFLIYPKAAEAYIPKYFNYLTNSTIPFFTLLETLISSHKYPSRKAGTTTLFAFLLLYTSWISYVHDQSGTWVYPILNIDYKTSLFLVLQLVTFGFYELGRKIDDYNWRTRLLRFNSLVDTYDKEDD